MIAADGKHRLTDVATVGSPVSDDWRGLKLSLLIGCGLRVSVRPSERR